ncbi:MAG: alpha-xylosidase, partial [Sphingobacteriales bacterium]
DARRTLLSIVLPFAQAEQVNTTDEVVMDLRSVNQLEKFNYVPRPSRGNGNLLKGTVYYSNNKENWTTAGTFEWPNNGDIKTFAFNGQPMARYIKLAVTDGVGGFGSGRELYVFKVPGTESYLPGDINNDRLIDRNDLISYINYTGLKKGDADFEGYISNGDINKNNVIDAYDISVVATQLDGGVKDGKADKLAGKIEIGVPKQNYVKDETVEITVKGINLNSVNALSFALPYNAQDLEFESVKTIATSSMENLTYDRLHTDGSKVLYPTFVNVGDKETLNGTKDLFIIKLKAKRKVKFGLKAVDGLLVDKKLNSIKF